MTTKKNIFFIFAWAALALILISCNLPETTLGTVQPGTPEIDVAGQESPVPLFHPPSVPPDFVPTADSFRELPSLQTAEQVYYVQAGDTLGTIANQFGVSAETIISYNALANPDLLSIGQEIRVPPPQPGQPAPEQKLIPDSELVNSAYNAQFDLTAFINQQGGNLAIYREEVQGGIMTGPQIVQFVANNYSVNPRLLVAIIEYQTRWLTSNPAHLDALSYPVGYADPNRSGLYKQLAWAADQLNRGFYLWQINALGFYPAADGILIPAQAALNGGTVGIHYLFAQLHPADQWREVVAEDGFMATYRNLFGNPWDWSLDPIYAGIDNQPDLILPFEPGVGWYFTGGPHGGWDNGSAWAAIDFAPPAEQLGCVQNNTWVTAMADGIITRSERGAVVQDLDGDGNPGTGWTILYMHVETRGRVDVGEYIQAGERIGHPSCEGGVSTGTHLHTARRFNGMWVSTDGLWPFVLGGWQTVGTGIQYDGLLQQGPVSIPACECQDPSNTITR
jgi:murein DD-endopeptidase MepM/ murein hydrolase activator NlpD